MADLTRTATVLLCISTLCCSAADPGSPPPATTFGAEVPDRAPDAPADPLPASPDFGAAAPALAAPDTTFYSLDAENHLVRFTLGAPSAVTRTDVHGLFVDETLAAIATRPKDGALYALGTTSRLYTLDPKTGDAHAVMNAPFQPGLAGKTFTLAFGFEDKARVASDARQNLALDPVTGWVANFDPTINYDNADTLAQHSPEVVANAWNGVAFYAIDAKENVLARMPSPANGSLETVGALGVDVESEAGLAITKDDKGVASGWAILRVNGESALYALDLDRGGATRVGSIGTAPLHGLVVAR